MRPWRRLSPLLVAAWMRPSSERRQLVPGKRTARGPARAPVQPPVRGWAPHPSCAGGQTGPPAGWGPKKKKLLLQLDDPPLLLLLGYSMRLLLPLLGHPRP